MSAPVKPPRAPRRWVPAIPERVVGPFTEGNLLRWVIGTGLGAFALGYLVITLLFFPGFGRSAIVTVPDLRGQPLREAERTLDRLGLELGRGGSLANPRIRAGAVLVQSPLPGQEVTRGAEIRVVLSAGPERHPVPPIAGLTLREARTLLERFGFSVKVQRMVADQEEGTFVGMRPRAGTLAVVPSVVTITLSAGPPKFPVPEVVALPLAEAEERLRAAGFRLGNVSYDPESTEALGGVASQRPAAGDSLRRGGAVNVTVSGTDPNPPPPVTEEPAVPDSAEAPKPEEPQAPPPQEFPPAPPPAER
ncbi:MAG TPA: PASTA domain-containing protein [Longimicrobium sp.]